MQTFADERGMNESGDSWPPCLYPWLVRIPVLSLGLPVTRRLVPGHRNHRAQYQGQNCQRDYGQHQR